MKCGSKMDLVSRPDHAVSPFWRVFFQGPRGLPCLQLPQACQNQHYRTKTFYFFRGVRRNVWHRRRMKCMLFPRSEGFFFKAPEVFLVYNFHKPAKTSIIVPKPYSFLVDSDATFDTGGGWHVDWKSSSSRPGHAVSLFWRVFFKVPEVFHVHNFHKPAKTSIIVPKPYSFLVDSDATFDIGGSWNVDWKWSSWVGQAMQFPRFEGFQDAGGLPCPQLPQACQNQHYRTKTL